MQDEGKRNVGPEVLLRRGRSWANVHWDAEWLQSWQRVEQPA